ncbi:MULTISPECIES: lantibiotic dehydratase [Streptomyces]|uniref:lantibiotic dehydratase n=1 Tax=Streptomyces TaxID=1883 RepID=UPI0031DC232A
MDTARARYAGNVGRWSRGDRKSEAGLVAYAHRAMLRTSPRARFTGVGFGMPGADHEEPTSPTVLVSAFDVQRGAVQTISESALDLGSAACVRLAPLLPAGDGRLGFLRVGDEGPRRVTVGRTPPLDALVAVARFGVHERRDVVKRLAVRLGCAEGAAERVVDGALRAQVLLPALPVDEQSPRFLDDTVDALPDGSEVREPLQRIAAAVGALPEQRRALLEDVAQAARQLPHAQQLGLGLYEDAAVAVGTPPKLPASLRHSIGTLLPVLSAFDLKHDLRLALHDAVRARGTRLSLTATAEDLAAEAARAVTGTLTPRLADPALNEALGQLWRFRQRVLTDIAELIGDSTDHDDTHHDDVALPDSLVAAWRAALPAWTDRPDASYALMLQPATTGPQWVCNGIFAGAGATLARFLHLDSLAGGRATQELRERLHRFLGPRVLEDRGCHGLNTGVHPPLLREAMTADDWADAVIESGDAPGDVRIRVTTRDGHRPVVITSTRWDLLPAPSRIALWLQGGGLVQPTFDQYVPRTAGITRVPRIRFGDLVLQRRRWYLPDLDLLTGAADGSEAGVRRLLALATEHGVPGEVFCKQLAAWQRAGGSMPDLTTTAPLQPKPRYLHLASPLGLKSLARDAAAFTHPFLEECLPAPREGAHAREYVYEFDRTTGGAAC